MLGTEYKWLLAPVARNAANRPQLARQGLTTLAVAVYCLILILTFAAPAPPVPSALTVAAPVTAALDTAQSAWPRALVNLWFILPQVLPGR